jgi:TetR/AcrR family transcriptional regulator
MKKPPEDLAEKLIAASSQFTGTGLDVSMDDVALASGVPRATLYYYFAGKDDLLDFYLSHKLDTMSTAMEKARASEGSVVDRLSGCIRAVLHAMAEQPALCLELPEALKRAKENFSEVAMKAETVMRRPLRDLLSEGNANGELDLADIELTLDALQGAVGQVAMARLMSVDGFDPDAVADQLIPLVVSGLTANR